MSAFLENIKEDIKGVLWWTFGLFLGLSLFTYSEKDPSFSSTGGAGTPIQNACGYIGSFIADFFYQMMGLMSWVLVFICFHRGLKNFKRVSFSYEFLKVAWAAFLIMSLTALFSLYFPHVKLENHQISVGGFLGLVLSSGLTDIFNFIGANVILWALSLMFWILYTEKSLKDLILWLFTFVLNIEKKTRVVKSFLFSCFSFLFFKVKQAFKVFFKKRKKKEKFSNLTHPLPPLSPAPSLSPPTMTSSFSFFINAIRENFKFHKRYSPLKKEEKKPLSFYPIKSESPTLPSKLKSSPLEPKTQDIIDENRSEESDKNKNKESEDANGIQSENEIESNNESEIEIQNKSAEKNENKTETNYQEKLKEPSPPLSSSLTHSLESPFLIQKKDWKLPPLSLFKSSFFNKKHKVNEKEVKEKASLLKEKLKKFNIEGEVLKFHTGPAVTLFEFKPQPDVKISRITDLADDLSLALSSESVRIIAPIPGRNVVGIETSNIQRKNVLFKDILFMKNQGKKTMKLPISLGLKADGTPKFVDLRKMPHMMVAGSTGSGKSAFILSALTGLLLSHSPETLRLILIDPKQVDLMSFNSLPHLLTPPVRTPQRALEALKWVLSEMEERYQMMSKAGARNLEAFNEIVSSPSFIESLHKNSLNKNALEENKDYKGPQPYIIVVIEEFSDLMAVDKAPVEKAVVKLAQMARACGIHLILAMQSPRRDVITGLIKTNIPGRISFKVASKLDSRIILDESGAERLLNCGDMLFLAPGLSQPERCHAPWVEEKDISKIIEFWKKEALSHALSFPPHQQHSSYKNLESFS